MARKPNFTIRRLPNGNWCVNVAASLTASGKRERPEFSTRDKAKAHATDLRTQFLNHGSKAGIISPALAEEASKASSKLNKWGVSLTQAVDEYIAQREREEASRPASEAIEEWLKWCEVRLSRNKLRTRTVRSYRQTGEKLKSALGKANLARLRASDLEKALDLKNAVGSGAALRFRNCRVFWRWCAKKKWCDKTILDEIDKVETSSDGEIEILSPKEISALMEACETYAPKFCSHFALLIFAGIRADEVKRLRSDLVTEAKIELPAKVAKKTIRRVIEPTENLAAWLRNYPFEPSSEWPKQFNRIRRIAGWDVKDARSLPKGLEKPTRGKWPQNCLRHSHASYVVKTEKDLKDLLFEFGHTDSPALLQSKYTNKAEVKDALEFFAIVPKGVKRPLTIKAV